MAGVADADCVPMIGYAPVGAFTCPQKRDQQGAGVEIIALQLQGGQVGAPLKAVVGGEIDVVFNPFVNAHGIMIQRLGDGFDVGRDLVHLVGRALRPCIRGQEAQRAGKEEKKFAAEFHGR